ncbi:acylphosphatase [Shimia sp. R10_1]|uniref:acylphosphatase n=1 Tax=Shimia sp. R10_1 TaxID=2821095 RepID=UPI001ADC7E66|nr:acylphosphatase [Shimia sp. R10_1]MBO9474239.1 acylphosphatase [Shimia sp. R10_1]
MAASASPPEHEERQTFLYVLKGKVQHVGFRNWTQREATRRGICGWVRNKSDTVELMFTASATEASDFEVALRNGPPRANVTSLESKPVRLRAFKSFQILESKGHQKQASAEGPSASPPLYHFDPEFVALCQSLYNGLPTSLRRHNRVDHIEKDWGFQQLEHAARAAGMITMRVDQGAPRRYLLQSETARLGLSSTRLSLSPYLDTVVANDKSLTMDALSHAGLPTPKSMVAQTEVEAEDVFDALGRCVVLKPSHGSNSVGVTTNLRQRDALPAAFALAQQSSPDGRVIVEEHVRGVDMRMLMAGDRFVAAYLRFPANVVGDGKASVAELIARKNTDRASVPGIGAANPIPTGPLAQALLKDQMLTLDAVPKQGQFVLLGLRPNTSDGADQINVTEHLHPELKDICVQATHTLGTSSLWGFDLITEDFTRPPSQARSVFCEANNRPFGGVFRHATHGPYVNFFAHALEVFAPKDPSQAWQTSAWEIVFCAPPSEESTAQRFGFRRAAQGDTWHLPLGLMGQDEALRKFGALQQNADLFGRLKLVDRNAPVQSPPYVHPSTRSQPRLTVSPAAEQSLTSAMSADFEGNGQEWRPQLIGREQDKGFSVYDTAYPTSFAEYAMQPKRLLALRAILGSAGLPIVPLRLIKTAAELGQLPHQQASLHLSRKWRGAFCHWVGPEPRYQSLAKQIPERCYPILQDPCASQETLECVILHNKILGAAVRTQEGFATLPSLPDGLEVFAAKVAQAIPGLGRARLICRASQQDPAIYEVQSVTTDLALPNFAAPDFGPPIDLALAIKERLFGGTNSAVSKQCFSSAQI